MTAEPAVLTVAETAFVLGVSDDLVYDLIRKGDLPALRLGSRIRVPRIQLDRLLAGPTPERAP